MIRFDIARLVNVSSAWSAIVDMSTVNRIWISPNLDEIYDVQWSPDSAYIIAGSINSKASLDDLVTEFIGQ